MTDTPRTILYIEDDDANRLLVSRTLAAEGYRVLTAERGLRGVDMARSHLPDLILVDLSLPDISGREITALLRADPRFKTTPIVALTAHDVNEQRELSFAAGLTGFMTKPLDIERLSSQIARYLAGERDVWNADAQSTALARSRIVQETVLRLEARIRELETANANLNRLDQMKDTFIQLTAHELRTPFTLLYGYNRLLTDSAELKRATAADPNLMIAMKGMNNAVERMQTIINEILTISRIMTNQIDLSIGATQLGTILMRALRPYAEALQARKLTIHFNKEEWTARIMADWELLEQVLSNLMSNAIKYTPDGGTISLRCKQEGDWVTISVKDTGIGIDPAQQAEIFETFSATHDPNLHTTSKTAFRGGGIGLGLALCKGIVEAHGGKISVESPGFDPVKLPGSEFKIQLPVVAKRTTPSRAAR